MIRSSKPLWNPADGMVFYSQNEAARYYGLDQSSVSKHMLGKLDHVGGYCLERLTEEEADEMGLDATEANEGHRIRCVDTGMEFESVRKAASYYGLSMTRISKVVRGQARTTGGLKFERIDGSNVSQTD